ncbi:FAD-dependent monooxygenase [Leucobacter albus]|uniref:FAD-dependent monooxygenase n=1 Tax=Leucobacter albus TaxID=272210 RepID=A0ABW3TQL8_9MICO
MAATQTHTQVAIVGAGPVGLTLALLLRHRGVGVRVFESHPGLSRHPKARGIAASSMEVFRGLGIERDVRAVSLPAEHVRFFRGESLVDPAAELTAPGGGDEGSANTPSPGVLCSQDRLEPVLAAAARAAGAELRFGARVTDVRQSPELVELVVAEGDEAPVRYTADVVAGCDGARSLVRERAGIALTGEAGLAEFLSVRFRAPLGEAVRGREATSYFIAGGKGGFLAIDNDTEWIYQYPLAAGAQAAALRSDDEALTRLVRDAAGLPELEVEVADTMLWRMDACVAESFAAGRLVLAGDSAHQTPPTGGHGMNVGIADAEALAWRLADAVGGGTVDAVGAALARYSEERLPVAAAVVARSLDNTRRAYGIDDELLLGAGYAPAPALPEGAYAPSGAIGRRLPHAALEADPGASIIDVAWGRARLIVADAPEPWRDRLAAIGSTSGEVPVVSVVSGSAATPGLCERAGLAPGEALLVRPDGVIAARGGLEPGDPWLERALSGVSMR